MARKKVNLKWITNNTTRRATYKRRSQVLEKKASDLTTLCGIKSCVVVYGEGEARPKVWPSDEEAKKLLKKFNDTLDVSSLKKTQNHEDFLQSRSLRLHEQVSKLGLENCEYETLVLLHDSMDGRRPGLIGTTKDELISLRDMVEMKMTKTKARLQQLVLGQGVLPEPLQELQPPVSSSLQTQPSYYSCNEMQNMEPLQEHPQQQKDLRNASLAPSSGDLDAMLYSPFAGSSSDRYNLGACSGLPWAQ